MLISVTVCIGIGLKNHIGIGISIATYKTQISILVSVKSIRTFFERFLFFVIKVSLSF